MTLESQYLIPRVEALNTVISETASALSLQFQYNHHLLVVPDRRSVDGIYECLVRAGRVVEEQVVNELVSTPLPAREMLKHRAACELPPILPQIVFKVALVKWAAIVLGWSSGGRRPTVSG